MADREGPLTSEGHDRHEAIQELLPWYLNDTLEANERDDVKRHLQSCAECRDELEELKGLQFATLLEPETSRASLYEGTLKRIRSGQPSASQRDPARRATSESGDPNRPGFLEWLGGWMKPRRLIAVPAFAVLFIAIGVALGTQLGLDQTIIGDFTDSEERAYQTTDRYFAFAREILLDGTFTMRIGSQVKETESFTLERSAETENQLLLTSNIQADELSARQRLQLTPDFRPISYNLQGPLIYQGNRAEAEFQGRQAVMLQDDAGGPAAQPSDCRARRRRNARVVRLQCHEPLRGDAPAHRQRTRQGRRRTFRYPAERPDAPGAAGGGDDDPEHRFRDAGQRRAADPDDALSSDCRERFEKPVDLSL